LNIEELYAIISSNWGHLNAQKLPQKVSLIPTWSDIGGAAYP